MNPGWNLSLNSLSKSHFDCPDQKLKVGVNSFFNFNMRRQHVVRSAEIPPAKRRYLDASYDTRQSNLVNGLLKDTIITFDHFQGINTQAGLDHGVVINLQGHLGSEGFV